MRVVVGERLGGPEVLSVAERAAPQPGPGEIVVDVAAAGVNFMDIYQREGAGGYRTEPPFVPGGEGAGTVAAVGEDVTGLAVGDRVAWAGPRCARGMMVLYGATSGAHFTPLSVIAAANKDPMRRAAAHT